MKIDRLSLMSRPKYILMIVFMIVFYILFAEASLKFTKIPNNTSAFWIPTGFSIALLIHFGLGFSPVLIVAKLILGLINDRPVSENIISMLASYTEAWVGHYLFYSFKETIEEHFEYHSNLVLISMVSFLAPVLSAMIGVSSLLYHGKIDESVYFSNWITWYLGDVLAAFIFLPAFLHSKLMKEGEKPEKMKVVDLIMPVLAAAFTYLFHFQSLNPFIFAIFVTMLIPSLFGTNRGMYFSLIAVALMLNWLQINHSGPFSVGIYQENLISMQFFLFALAFTALTIEGFKRTGLIKNAIFPLLCLWFLAGSVYFYYHTQKDINDEKNLNDTISDFSNRLSEKMIYFRNSMKGVAGFVASSEKVSVTEWNQYIESISLVSPSNGIKIISLIYPDMSLSKDIFFYDQSKKQDYFLINREAINHPVIQTAREKAKKERDIVMTFPQNFNIHGLSMKLSFFIMPVYKNDRFIGWVVASFELEKVIASMIDSGFENIDIDVYAGSGTIPEHLIYSKIIDQRFRKHEVNPKKLSVIEILGQDLTIYWNETSRFISLHNSQNSLFVLVGAIFSLVVTSFFINLNLLNVRANKMAMRKTKELSESEEKFKSLFNHSSDAVILFDGFQIIDCNPESLVMFGKNSKREMLGTTIKKLFNFEELEQKLKEARELKVTSFESVFKRYNQSFFAETHLHYLEVKDNFLYQAVVRDISERKKTEQNLIKSKELAEDAAKAKSQFLSTMSHEIRTPLNGVIGMINIILEEHPQSEIKEDLETIKYSADSLLHVVNEVLDYNKIEAGKITLEKNLFSLKNLCENLIKIHHPKAQAKKLELKLNFDQAIPEFILGDEYRNSQILHNLLSNALKFTEKGHVILDVKLKTLRELYAEVTFTIIDTGIGIDEDKKQEIFKDFTQAESDHARKYGGTGLGLAISRRLVEIQKGKLNLDSVKGSGTTFSYTLTFNLPDENLISAENEKALVADSHADVHFNGEHILLVEDNEINVYVTKKFLERWGLKIEVAVNGLDAVEKARSQKYKLILMDLHMPVMDGLEATRLIREFDQTTPIIGLSADVMTDNSTKLSSLGMNDFVTKPFKPNEFLHKISSFI